MNTKAESTLECVLEQGLLKLKTSALAKVHHISEADLRLDAELLLAFCLNKNRSFIHAWPEHDLSTAEQKKYRDVIQQRGELKPLAYITASQEFWSLNFTVNQNVLIPRPETECLVEFILDCFSDEAANSSGDSSKKQTTIKGLDLGTGSGAIALSLAHEKPNWEMQACDFSESALEVAKQNSLALDIQSVDFLHSDWFDKITDNDFDFIVSNPPYVEDDALELSTEGIQFEPRSALCSGEDGLDDIKIICTKASHYLKANGLLIIEHGANQGSAVIEIFQKNNFNKVKCLPDYAGLDRFTIGYKS